MWSDVLSQCVRVCGVLLICTCLGCATAQDHVDRYAHQTPSVAEFTICHGYGCRLREVIRIEPFAWEAIANLFKPVPTNAEEERQRLGRAVALLEVKIGSVIGTNSDEAAADLLGGDPDQLDCIDETVNTTTYLRLLEKQGLMQRHHVGRAAQRGSVSGFRYNDFITNSAVIIEKDTGVAFAVDSYFYANGRDPQIMPLSEWKKNWRPSTDDPRLQPLS